MDSPAPRRATSKDVARLAGVSRSTVSQVLNGSGDRFPSATRRRVRDAAEQLSYRPSRAGRALVTGRSNVVVVVAPNVTFGHHFQDAIEEMSRESASSGWTVVARFAGVDDAHLVPSLIDIDPAAVVDFGGLSSGAREALRDAGIPVVPRSDDLAMHGSLDPQNAVARLQVEEVLRAQPRRVIHAMIADTRLDLFGPTRATAIASLVADAGGGASVDIRVPLEAAGAAEALAPYVDDVPLGVCCYNDEVALAVLAGARLLGLSVPDDVSVVGMDATAVGQLVTPRLTTVRFDLTLSSRAIIRELQGHEPEVDDVAVPIALVRGETT